MNRVAQTNVQDVLTVTQTTAAAKPKAGRANAAVPGAFRNALEEAMGKNPADSVKGKVHGNPKTEKVAGIQGAEAETDIVNTVEKEDQETVVDSLAMQMAALQALSQGVVPTVPDGETVPEAETVVTAAVGKTEAAAGTVQAEPLMGNTAQSVPEETGGIPSEETSDIQPKGATQTERKTEPSTVEQTSTKDVKGTTGTASQQTDGVSGTTQQTTTPVTQASAEAQKSQATADRTEHVQTGQAQDTGENVSTESGIVSAQTVTQTAEAQGTVPETEQTVNRDTKDKLSSLITKAAVQLEQAKNTAAQPAEGQTNAVPQTEQASGTVAVETSTASPITQGSAAGETQTATTVQGPAAAGETQTAPITQEQTAAGETQTAPITQEPAAVGETQTAPITQEPLTAGETQTAPVAQEPMETGEIPTNPAAVDENPTAPIGQETQPETAENAQEAADVAPETEEPITQSAPANNRLDPEMQTTKIPRMPMTETSKQVRETAPESMRAEAAAAMQEPVPVVSREPVPVEEAAVRPYTQASPAEQVQTEVVRNLENQRMEFRMQLNPQELGRVSVRMVVENGRLMVEMAAATPKAEEMLRTQAAGLLTGLRENSGYQVDSVQVVSGAGVASGHLESAFNMNRESNGSPTPEFEGGHYNGRRGANGTNGENGTNTVLSQNEAADRPRQLLNYSI